jgi:translation initiation factor IF-2
MNKDKQYRDRNVSQRDKDDMSNIAPKKGQFIKPKPVVVEKEEIKVITIPEVLTIKELADKMRIPGAALIKKLFLAGQVVTINQEITYEEAEEIALEYDIISEKEILVNEVEELLKEEDEDEADMVKRPPVVCVMGHVDHGKTSLLDAIRHANVTSREAGGITQHIGAYIVEIKGEKITFLDTPGHEAFTSMRMRGAQATDIAILVVAADDGVMPQTVEAISHAKAAGVKIIVAINKIDKPSANVERVKQELTEHELIAEDWGGDTIFVPVSAHTKEGIEHLLEMILLTAEMEELKANPNRTARGLVIEAELDKGRGPVATILVQKGTLRVGDNIVVGSSYGKVRAMIDDKGRRAEEAGPSTPVEILGLNSVPDVGEIFMSTESEKESRTISEAFITQGKEKLISDTKAKLSLDGLFSQIQAGNIKELNLIIKADVQGSVEAMKQSLLKLSNDEVAVRVIHGGVGAINESDVILASTSNGIIIGFNVKPDTRAKEIAEYENVDIKLYRVIYNAINDVEAAMKGLLDPVYEEKIIGHAEVRQIFKASGLGTIAGSYVLDGKITRGCKVRIYRDNELIHEGALGSLKRFQDDVKEVAAGYECGLVFDKFNDVKEEDKVEFYVMVEVPR